jgi:hypothetical protein
MSPDDAHDTIHGRYTYKIDRGRRYWKITVKDPAGHWGAVGFVDVSAGSDGRWLNAASWAKPADSDMALNTRHHYATLFPQLGERFPQYRPDDPETARAELLERMAAAWADQPAEPVEPPRRRRREITLGDLYQGGSRPDIDKAGIELHGTSGARAQVVQLSAVFTGAYVTGWSMRVEAAHAAMVHGLLADEIAADVGADRGRRIGGHVYLLTWEKPDATVTATVPPDYDLPAYPEVGSVIPDMPGYRVGRCGHRVAASEWRAGFRTCERCPDESDDTDDTDDADGAEVTA